MKQMRTHILLATALFSAAASSVLHGATTASNSALITTFVPRAQGRDKTIQMIGSTDNTHLADCANYWTLSIIPEYTRSFRPQNITQCFFGPFLVPSNNSTSDDDNNNNALLIQGSNVANRNPLALIADNFYLPQDYSSVVTFKPRISNAMVNFDFYVGLNNMWDGLYVRLYGPFVHTKWNLRMEENIIAPGNPNLAYPAGAFTEGILPRSDLLSSFISYAQGDAPASTSGLLTGSLAEATAATIFDGLQYGRMLQNGRHLNGFSELRAELGWDFINCDDYHLGIDIQMAFPTGRLPSACLLFGPRIGDDKWELGVGLTGHYVFWRSECEDAHFGFYLDANVNHLFKKTESRVFDLQGKPLSRYLLAARFSPINEQLFVSEEEPSNPAGACSTTPSIPAAGDITQVPASSFQFAREFAPVANLTQRDVRISIGAEADIVAMFNLTYCNFSWDLGYDFWARSKEKLHVSEENPCQRIRLGSSDQLWGLKGTEQVLGFTAGTSISVPLTATQSFATINNPIISTSQVTQSCTGVGEGPVSVFICNGNNSIDNPEFAFAAGDPADALVCIPNTSATNTGLPGATTANQIETSNPPVLLNESQIDYGQRTRGLSNKVFTHLQYNFDCECWSPYIGVGGFGEWGSHGGHNNENNNITTNNSENSHGRRCSLSQWGVWVKLGFSFN